jgi:lipoprotein-anchoring transpeptidase ErfK/SrfK
MGLSAPLVGIHGTPDAASIGYSASHGCIRMRISDAEYLYDQIDIGTPVVIV